MCDCLEQVALKLEEINIGLDIPLRIDMKTGKQLPPLPVLAVYKLDPKKRGRPPTLFAKFCPFCGMELPR